MSDRKHNHYFKSVEGLTHVDVYRVLALFNVTDPCLQHAVKKLLVAGGRGGGKDISRDIQEASGTVLGEVSHTGHKQSNMAIKMRPDAVRLGSVILTPSGRDLIIENVHHCNKLLVEHADLSDLYIALKQSVYTEESNV